MKSTNQIRRVTRLLAHSYIFVIALGVIMMVTADAIGQYYWAASNYTSLDARYLDVTLFFYGMLTVIAGAVWGIVKLLFFD